MAKLNVSRAADRETIARRLTAIADDFEQISAERTLDYDREIWIGFQAPHGLAAPCAHSHSWPISYGSS